MTKFQHRKQFHVEVSVDVTHGVICVQRVMGGDLHVSVVIISQRILVVEEFPKS